MRTLLPVSLLFLTIPLVARADPCVLKNRQRVVFLGDSNTFAGTFIAYLDAYLCTRFPDKRIELINLGLPSETVSGLSEPDHPYPRPDVHTRLDRALELTKPNVVVACYGMNDGIYYPFGEERLKKYQDGIGKLIEKCEKAGAKVVFMTPAPFDPTPLKDKVLPKSSEKFSWMRPYEKYDDEVLAKYSQWLLTFRAKGRVVVDAHAAVLKHIESMRKEEPAYWVSGDGIHPDANGHLVIARELIAALTESEKIADTELKLRDASTTKFGVAFALTHPTPMPADPKWNGRFAATEPVRNLLNPYRLRIKTPPGKFAVMEGDEKHGELTDDQLAGGIDLAGYPKLSMNLRRALAWKKIEEKNRILGLAWLTHVGHLRPDTPKGIPLAEATTKAAKLDDEIRKLCAPVEMKLRLAVVR